jgi:hypothetical protein
VVTVKYSLTEDEYKAFSYYTGWQSPAKKTYRIKYFARTLLFYLVAIFIIFFTAGNFILDFNSILIFAVVAILLFVYLQIRIKLYYDGIVKKVIKESGENRILPVTELTVSETGINSSSDLEDVTYKWNAIMKKTEVNKCYYLYLNARQALVIPQRVFASQNEKQEFDKLLAAHLPLQAEFINHI